MSERRQPGEAANICKEIHAEVKRGKSVTEALKGRGVHKSNYYNWRKKHARPATKQKPGPKPASSRLVELPPTRNQKIIAIVGNAKEVIQSLRGLL